MEVSLTFHNDTKMDENLRIKILEMTGVDDREIEIRFSEEKAYLTVPSTCLDDLAAIDEVYHIKRFRETESQDSEVYLIMGDGTKSEGRVLERSGESAFKFVYE